MLTLSMHCNSQSPIFNLYNSYLTVPPNAYIKDMYNEFDQFEGTWVLDDGTNYLKIIILKKEQVFTGQIYQDLLIGEYLYKKNGVVVINSLPQLNAAVQSIYLHKIWGSYIPFTPSPFFSYTDDNFRVSLTFRETIESFTIDIRRTEINGEQVIQIFKRIIQSPRKQGSPAPINIVPNGLYYLKKV